MSVIVEIVAAGAVKVKSTSVSYTVVSVMVAGVDQVAGGEDDMKRGSMEVEPGVHVVTMALDLDILPGGCVYALELDGRMSTVVCLEE